MRSTSDHGVDVLRLFSMRTGIVRLELNAIGFRDPSVHPNGHEILLNLAIHCAYDALDLVIKDISCVVDDCGCE